MKIKTKDELREPTVEICQCGNCGCDCACTEDDEVECPICNKESK